jgi:pimeloyl-ACP methyl ester carboxylesterase
MRSLRGKDLDRSRAHGCSTAAQRRGWTIGYVLLPHDDVGAGLAVVLLHAGITDRRMWADHLRPIADAGYRVVAMDLPGFGEAPPAQEEAAWSDVVQTMDALNLDRAALVGNSFGGAVARWRCAWQSSRLSGLWLSRWCRLLPRTWSRPMS